MSKAIVYINQFFGGYGGEEKADHEPEIRDELVGPANLYNQLLDAEVAHTIICGDNFVGSNEEEAVERILGFLEDKEFDIFFAGPAFQAGRYGNACGVIGKAVKEKFDVPVISSMNEENPGVEMYKKDIYIFPGGRSAAKMKDDVTKVVGFGNKLLNGEDPGPADEEGYYKRGIRHQVWREDAKPAADRGVEMLIKKLNGEDFESELPIPELDRVEIADPIEDLSEAKVALVTSGGIVPVDNPDNIQSASATRWGKYDISGMDKLENREAGAFRTSTLDMIQQPVMQILTVLFLLMPCVILKKKARLANSISIFILLLVQELPRVRPVGWVKRLLSNYWRIMFRQ